MVGGARQQREGPFEAAGLGCQLGGQAQVPLATHQRLVAGFAQQFGQGNHAVVEVAFITGLADQVGCQRLCHGADAGDVVVGAGQQHGTGRRAGRRGVEVGEAQAGVGQGVEVRRGNLPAEGAEVGETEVVGKYHQKIGALAHGQVLASDESEGQVTDLGRLWSQVVVVVGQFVQQFFA
ncbi:hypothetical protein D9M71_155460 [compost metagenome]